MWNLMIDYMILILQIYDGPTTKRDLGPDLGI